MTTAIFAIEWEFNGSEGIEERCDKNRKKLFLMTIHVVFLFMSDNHSVRKRLAVNALYRNRKVETKIVDYKITSYCELTVKAYLRWLMPVCMPKCAVCGRLGAWEIHEEVFCKRDWKCFINADECSLSDLTTDDEKFINVLSAHISATSIN